MAGLAVVAAVLAGAPAQAGSRAAVSGSAVDRVYVTQVRLTGKAAKPRGEPQAFGTVTICVVPVSSSISYGFEELLITSAPTAAHIHRGAAGVVGPIVFAFARPGAVDPLIGDVQWYGGGKATKSAIAALVASPGKHYVNVHTRKHPNGAVRGQLGSWRILPRDAATPAVCAAD